MFLLSLDEIDRVKRLHHITSNAGLAEKTGLSRKTWTVATNSRKPSTAVLAALAELGANPSKVLVSADDLAA